MARQKFIAYIGLGGNVGDVPASMALALQALDRHKEIRVARVSPVYKTPPWGLVDQDWFHNACVELATTLQPEELLTQCLVTEKSLKRVRRERWGPRIIDLDILIIDDLEIVRDNLVVPHARLHERAFALKPLCDLAPGLPLKGKTVSDWLNKLDATQLQPLELKDNWYMGRETN